MFGRCSDKISDRASRVLQLSLHLFKVFKSPVFKSIRVALARSHLLSKYILLSLFEANDLQKLDDVKSTNLKWE